MLTTQYGKLRETLTAYKREQATEHTQREVERNNKPEKLTHETKLSYQPTAARSVIIYVFHAVCIPCCVASHSCATNVRMKIDQYTIYTIYANAVPRHALLCISRVCG